MTGTAKLLLAEGLAVPQTQWRIGVEPSTLTLEDFNHLLVWAYANEISDLTLCTDEPPLGLVGTEWARLGVRALGREELDLIVMDIYGKHGPSVLGGGEALDFAHEITLSRRRRIRFRANAQACQTQFSASGVSLSLRVIADVPPSLDDLQVEPAIVAAHRMASVAQGLVLTVGATGTGKTTLQAAMLRDVIEREPALKVATIESPIEYVLSTVAAKKGFVVQAQVGKHVRSFADGIRNAMRQKPNVILLGEARDTETMGELINASITGHCVYSTVHAPSVAQAFPRIVKAFPADHQRGVTATLIDVMRLCVTQRLVPKVGGGRIALREYLVFDQGVRNRLLRVNPDDLGVAVHAEVQGCGQTLLKDAEQKHAQGRISRETLAIVEAEWRDDGVSP